MERIYESRNSCVLVAQPSQVLLQPCFYLRPLFAHQSGYRDISW